MPRFKSISSLYLAIAFAVGGLSLPISVQAQESPAEEEEARPEGIESITVTARKREESLEDTPISITALSANDLEARGIVDVGDLANAAPNLGIQGNSTSTTNSIVFIRGVGQSDLAITNEPGVGTYIDGVYTARLQMGLFTLFDVERIEVLRGPQGTLFGRNTTGGAVSIVTKKPTGEWGGKAKVRLGNYQLFETQGALDFPIIPEVLAGRFSFSTATRDGYHRDTGTGRSLDDFKFLGGRLALMYTPTDRLEILLAAERTQQNQELAARSCVRRDGIAASGVPIATGGLVNLANRGSAFLGVPDLDLDENCAANSGRPHGKRGKFRTDGVGADDNDLWSTTITATYDVSDTMTFKSISAWRQIEWDQNQDVDAFFTDALPLLNGMNPRNEQRQWTQEFQLNGTSLDGQFDWTLGAYYFRETVQDRNRSVSVFSQRDNSDLIRHFVGQQADPDQRGGRLDTDNHAFAGFFQGTYNLTDRLSITGGLRRTVERKEFQDRELLLGGATDPNPTRSAIPPASGVVEQKDRFRSWTPMANISFHVNDDIMLYGGWSRGFKSGTFNGRPNPNIPETQTTVESEKVSAWEIGAKTAWFDRRLTANLAAFYNYYDEIQITTLQAAGGTATSILSNAGDARIRGLELEVKALPIPALLLEVGIGITDAEFIDFTVNDEELTLPNGAPLPVDVSDRKHRQVPAYTLNAGMAYTFPEMDFGTLTVRADYYAQSKMFNEVKNLDVLATGKYHKLDGRIALALPDGKTEIALFGRNLTNKRIIRFGFELFNAFGVGTRLYNAPRTYGIEISRTFL